MFYGYTSIHILSNKIVNNYGGNIANTIGRICRFNSGGLPSSATATGSYMKIVSSNFYGTGGPVPNYGIPDCA